MNRFVVKSAMQGLMNGRSYCGSIIINGQVYNAAVVGRSALSGQQNGMAFGAFEWRRMISSAAPAASAEKVPFEKEDKKENPATEDKDRKEMVTSYWGISRPKVTREDGTDWPWNCFMV